MTDNRKLAGIALRILCAMLLVALGFAHKPTLAPASQNPDMASYVLPDGSVASLCLPDEDRKQDRHVDRDCEACRIASAIAIPQAPIDGEEIARLATIITRVFAPEAFHRLNFPPNAPPRGPPAIQVSSVTA